MHVSCGDVRIWSLHPSCCSIAMSLCCCSTIKPTVKCKATLINWGVLHAALDLVYNCFGVNCILDASLVPEPLDWILIIEAFRFQPGYIYLHMEKYCIAWLVCSIDNK